METNYKPNSHKYKENNSKKELSKVVSNKAVIKTNNAKKLADMFISEDVNDVKNYVFIDVLVPAIKKAIFDIVTNGIDMILYGENSNIKSRSTASKISYRDYYDKKPSYDSRTKIRSRSSFDYDDICFETRNDAERVLSEMENVVDKFEFVSIGDLYDLCDISTTNYESTKYGWNENIHSASVIRTKDGYSIKFPRAILID